MDWTEEIKNVSLADNKYSQCGEECYIEYILKNIGSGNNFLVEFGAQNGFWLSNSRRFIEKGYDHILMDYDASGDVHKEFISKENICELLKKYDCPKEFSFLSIDIDGNDYWVLKELCREYSPKLIVCEVNGVFPIDDCRTIKYNPDHKHLHNDYYGFSMGACIKLAKELGYAVVFQNDSLNAYLVRKDLVEDKEYELNYVPKHSTYSHEGEWVSV
ncbi:MAG: FkbM family methyltransferase [Acidiferrobacterales bacterium]